MIPPDTWIPEMVWYAGFVADDLRLRRAWVERDRSFTSVTDYNELFVQIFDDQDADSMEPEMVALLDPARARAIGDFLSAIRTADRVIEADEAYRDMSVLLASDTWRGVQEAARAVVAAFDAQPWTPSTTL